MSSGGRSYFPSPLVGEGGASRSEATGEGLLRLGKLCENILQNARRSLQHVIVPISRDPESLGGDHRIPCFVASGFCVLTAIDFNDQVMFKANEIKNEVLKGDLPAKLEASESSVT